MDTTKASIQTRQEFTEEKEIQMEETPAYAPLVERAINKKWYNELIWTQHELAQCKKEVIPAQEYQALLKKFMNLSTTEDETFAQLREE